MQALPGNSSTIESKERTICLRCVDGACENAEHVFLNFNERCATFSIKLELGSWEEMCQFGYVQQDTVEMNWHILLACALVWSKMFHSNVREIERVKPCSTSRSKRDRNGSEHLPFVLTFAYMFRATFENWKELQQRTTQKGEEILHRESHICKQAKNIKNKVKPRLWVCLFEEKHSIHCLINIFLIFSIKNSNLEIYI